MENNERDELHEMAKNENRNYDWDSEQERLIQETLNKAYEGAEMVGESADGSGRKFKIHEVDKKEDVVMYKEDVLSKRTSEQTISGPPEAGEWSMIMASSLPCAAFYPSDMEVWIRKVTVKDIQLWSNMKEDNGYSFVTELARVVTSCCRLRRRKDGSWLKPDLLRANDKLFLVFKIREISFSSKDGFEIDYVHELDTCNHAGKYKMKTRDLKFYDLNEIMLNLGDEEVSIMEFYNKDEFAFEFSYGDREEPFYMAPPTIGVEVAFYEWAKEKYEKNPKFKFDEAFINLMPSMMHDKMSLTSKQIDAAYKDFKDIDSDEYVFLEYVAKTMRVGVESVEHKCDSCGAEVHSELSFPDGVKSILLDKTSAINKLHRPGRKI